MLNDLLAKNQSSDKLYVEDVFSTWLYTGNGSTQTITNGIDLAGKGGMVWTKRRDDASVSHILMDTVRGTGSQLYSNTTGSQGISTNLITAFNSNGYSIGASTAVNASGSNTASWTFRKAPKFFDVVTYTGNGSSNQTINHNLGSVPGMIIVKLVSNTSTYGWQVYHRSLSNSDALLLNTTGAAVTDLGWWFNTTPTSTTFKVGDRANTNGESYIAYLFAHDTTADGVIQCGSFTSDGFGNATVALGWEPQYVLYKRSSDTGNWNILDTMRGFVLSSTDISASDDAQLLANTTGAETLQGRGYPFATGFAGGFGVSGTHIYLAIRRGPMRVPTDATKVFKPALASSSGVYTAVSDFPVDAVWYKDKGGSNGYDFDRLRGNPYLTLETTNAETTSTGAFDSNVNFRVTSASGNFSSYINWLFRRAPGFFDVVCYTGTGSNTTQSHNLGVVPELMIVKSRSLASAWYVYAASEGATKRGLLSASNQFAAETSWNNTGPTASVFSVGASGVGTNNSGATYVAYLFATCPGVSKVGSYTGTGTTQQINCGFTNGARFVLIKRTDSTGDWYVYDSARGIVAGNDPYLLLNSTAAEVTNTDYVDAYSAGFELSSTAPAALNANGGTYIYLAIA